MAAGFFKRGLNQIISIRQRLSRWRLAVILLSCLLLLSCQAPEQPKNPGGRIEIEFWTLQMLSFSDLINGMIQDYEAAHPNVRIKWVDVPFSEGEKRALTSMLGGNTPDVINLNPDFSAILASRGALLDMNRWVPASTRHSYLPVAWEAASLNNQAFGLPWYITSAVTLYNQKLLQQAGYNAPPADYPRLKAMAGQIRAKTNGYLLMPILTEGGRFFRVLMKAGVPVWNDTRTRLVFADHGAEKILAFWVDLYRRGLIPKESLTETQQAAVDRYQSGTLALLPTGPNFLNIVRENAPDVYARTDIAPQFPESSPVMEFSEMLLVVPKRTEHPKEAVDFALFITNPENTLRLAEKAPVLPPHGSVLQQPAFQQPDASDKPAKGRSVSARQLLAARHAMPVHPRQSVLNQRMDFYVQSAMLGKLTPAEAMHRAQQEMNDLIANP